MNSTKLRMHQKALIVYSDELFTVLKEALPIRQIPRHLAQWR